MQSKNISPAFRKSRRLVNRVIIALSISTLIIRLIDPCVSTGSFVFQSLVWFVFLIHATIYSSKAYNIRPFWRFHQEEWVIILLWNPVSISMNGPSASLDMAHRLIEHTALVCQFLGLLAHFWLVARSFRKEWGQHPLFCAALCVCSITGLIATLLREYEPTTFTDWPTTLWFCLETISTVGYGDVVPHGLSAKFLSFALIIFGGGVHSVLLAFVGQRLIDLVEWRHPLQRNRDLKKSASPSTDELLVELIAKVESLQSQLEAQNSQQQLTGKDKNPGSP